MKNFTESDDKKLTQEQQWAKGINGAIKVIGGENAAVVTGTGDLGAVVGGAAMGFAASNMTEGIIDICNSVQGKDEKSINPIKDFLFMGNKDFYDATDLALNLGAGTLGIMSHQISSLDF